MENRKNIWIFCHYAVPPELGRWVRHYQLAKELQKYGWHPTIIAADFHHGMVENILNKNEKARYSNHRGVNFLWIKTSRYAGNGVRRIKNMFQYSLRVLLPFFLKKLERPDVIIGTTAHTLAALSGLILAKRYRVPFVYEVRDIWPESMIELGVFSKGSLPARLITVLEKHLLWNAEKIITTLPKAYTCFEKYGVNKNKVCWITNGVDTTSFPKSSLVDHEGPFCYYYLGTFGKANGLHILIEAMRFVNKIIGRKIELYLMGDGPYKDELKDLAKSYNLHNIFWLKPVDKSEIPGIVKKVDGFVISILDRPELYKYGISMNKLFDYMAGSRPIVFGGNVPSNPVEKSGAGLVVVPENPLELAKAMKKLANESFENRVKMGNNGRNYLEKHFSSEILGKKLSDMLEEVINNRNRNFKLNTEAVLSE